MRSDVARDQIRALRCTCQKTIDVASGRFYHACVIAMVIDRFDALETDAENAANDRAARRLPVWLALALIAALMANVVAAKLRNTADAAAQPAGVVAR
jgi:hypothetical protein